MAKPKNKKQTSKQPKPKYGFDKRGNLWPVVIASPTEAKEAYGGDYKYPEDRTAHERYCDGRLAEGWTIAAVHGDGGALSVRYVSPEGIAYREIDMSPEERARAFRAPKPAF